MSKKIALITGVTGQVGTALSLLLPNAVLLSRADLDLTQPNSIAATLDSIGCDVLINCAAYTAVDAAESDEDTARLVNSASVEAMAQWASGQGAKLVTYSTDYVFDGESSKPYDETSSPNPQTVYGTTKMLGEMAAAKYCENSTIVRIAWLYGPGGPSFLHTMLALDAKGVSPLKVVDDQTGNPTSTDAVAGHIKLLLEHPEITGPIHLTCEGRATWFEFAAEIFRLSGSDCKTVPCSTSEFPRPAPRPANSQLDNLVLTKHNLPPMPHWQNALEAFFRENPNG